MPVYTYTALSKNGALTSGEAVADTRQELQQELARRGLLLQTVRKKAREFGWLRRRLVKPEAFLLFNQEFIALIRAGLPIPEALTLAASRPDQPGLAAVLQRVLADVKAGSLLSEACARHPMVFDGLYLSALRTGEKSGGLVAVLGKYQQSLKAKVEFKKKVSQALAYPLFLLLTLVVILGVLFVFVMPRFIAMYADFGAQLPLPTRVLIVTVEHLHVFIPLVTAASIGLWLAWRRWVAREDGRIRVDDIKTRLPVLGAINRHIAYAQFARTMATLLDGGTPLVEAMHTTQASLDNRAHAVRLARAAVLVSEGKSLAEALQTMNLMPDAALKMVQVGEASGGLGVMLAEIAQYYEEMLTYKLARATALIEPMLMLLMGVLIGGVIVVMYLPIFYMVDIVK